MDTGPLSRTFRAKSVLRALQHLGIKVLDATSNAPKVVFLVCRLTQDIQVKLDQLEDITPTDHKTVKRWPQELLESHGERLWPDSGSTEWLYESGEQELDIPHQCRLRYPKDRGE